MSKEGITQLGHLVNSTTLSVQAKSLSVTDKDMKEAISLSKLEATIKTDAAAATEVRKYKDLSEVML